MRQPSETEIGLLTARQTGHWVQTERKAHEAWARLIVRKPRAAMLMHHLVARMGEQNAVVISQKTLSKLAGCSVETIKRATRDLVAERWVTTVKLSGPGTVNAYVINDRVAWGQPRDKLKLSMFSATVVADFEDQDEALLGNGELRKIPSIFPGERQLPAGAGEAPPSQALIGGMEPDLPARKIDRETGEILHHLTETEELENLGQQRLVE